MSKVTTTISDILDHHKEHIDVINNLFSDIEDDEACYMRENIKYFVENGEPNCWGCYVSRTWGSSQIAIERCHINANQFGGKDEPHNFILLCKDCHAKSSDIENQSIDDMLRGILSERIDLADFAQTCKYPGLVSQSLGEIDSPTIFIVNTMKMLKQSYGMDLFKEKFDFNQRVVRSFNEELKPKCLDREDCEGYKKSCALVFKALDFFDKWSEKGFEIGNHFGIQKKVASHALWDYKQITNLKSIAAPKSFYIKYHIKLAKKLPSRLRKEKKAFKKFKLACRNGASGGPESYKYEKKADKCEDSISAIEDLLLVYEIFDDCAEITSTLQGELKDLFLQTAQNRITHNKGGLEKWFTEGGIFADKGEDKKTKMQGHLQEGIQRFEEMVDIVNEISKCA